MAERPDGHGHGHGHSDSHERPKWLRAGFATPVTGATWRQCNLRFALTAQLRERKQLGGLGPFEKGMESFDLLRQRDDSFPLPCIEVVNFRASDLVELGVKTLDLQFGLQIHPVVQLRVEPVF